jgi:predicted porin
MGNFAYAPARAADLGGGCCADLEERVAELEATTARKGNRVVSLQVYGQVNKALLIWDDGDDSDVFVVDNDNSSSRIGFTGSAKMKPGWTAGYLIELDIQDAASDKIDNDRVSVLSETGTPVVDDPADEIAIRYNNVYIESERLGRLTLGQGSTAADGAYEVVLGNALRNPGIDHGNSIVVVTSTGVSTYRLQDYVSDFDGGRDDLVRYDSPSLYGFIVSASWGDNDYADLALRYKNEWNSIRVAAAIAYQWDASNDAYTSTAISDADVRAFANSDFEAFGGSISVMHVPTGIYGAFAAGTKEFTDDDEFDSSFWYVQLGFERKLLPYGTTTIYGEWGQYDDVLTLVDPLVTSSESDRWGFGIVQKFDSAAMEIYGQATFWSFDAVQEGTALDLEDISTVMIGSRIKF